VPLNVVGKCTNGKSLRTILGYGVVTGDYEYHPKRDWYANLPVDKARMHRRVICGHLLASIVAEGI